MNTNTLTTLRNTSTIIATATVGKDTIELLMNNQEAAAPEYRTHFLVFNNEWNMTSYRNRKIAQAEYDNTVEFWNVMA